MFRKASVFVLTICLMGVLYGSDTPTLLGISLFQDCLDLEKSSIYKELGITKQGGMPLRKKYFKEKLVVDNMEIGQLSVWVGKNIKARQERMKAEKYKFPYKFDDDPFLKSAEGYIVLGIEFSFRPSQWEKLLTVLKRDFGKPTEETIKINPKVKHVNARVKWVFEDGSSLDFQSVSALGAASVRYLSGW